MEEVEQGLVEEVEEGLGVEVERVSGGEVGFKEEMGSDIEGVFCVLIGDGLGKC